MMMAYLWCGLDYSSTTCQDTDCQVILRYSSCTNNYANYRVIIKVIVLSEIFTPRKQYKAYIWTRGKSNLESPSKEMLVWKSNDMSHVTWPNILLGEKYVLTSIWHPVRELPGFILFNSKKYVECPHLLTPSVLDPLRKMTLNLYLCARTDYMHISAV